MITINKNTGTFEVLKCLKEKLQRVAHLEYEKEALEVATSTAKDVSLAMSHNNDAFCEILDELEQLKIDIESLKAFNTYGYPNCLTRNASYVD